MRAATAFAPTRALAASGAVAPETEGSKEWPTGGKEVQAVTGAIPRTGCAAPLAPRSDAADGGPMDRLDIPLDGQREITSTTRG